MRKHSLIEDDAIRKAIIAIEKRLDRIESIPQVPEGSDTAYIINVINKITDKMKRRRA